MDNWVDRHNRDVAMLRLQDAEVVTARANYEAALADVQRAALAVMTFSTRFGLEMANLAEMARQHDG